MTGHPMIAYLLVQSMIEDRDRRVAAFRRSRGWSGNERRSR
jgi:hypothetical protein